MEREVKLSAANYCYKTEYTDVYHVGKSKIHIFSSLEGFITEEHCFKLSKVETSRILLPTPVYQNGRYVGCRTKWQEKDWIYAFYNSGMSLKRNSASRRMNTESGRMCVKSYTRKISTGNTLQIRTDYIMSGIKEWPPIMSIFSSIHLYSSLFPSCR